MKYLPPTLLVAVLALALHAQSPQPQPSQPQATPPAAPPGDPFVKNAGDNPTNDNERQEESPNLVVVFESYAMSMDDAAALLAAESGSTARYRLVLDLAKAGKTLLQTLTALSTKSGQRAVTESIDEVRYGTAFDGIETPNDVPPPVTWETRNVGDTFEFEPVMSPDHKLCDLNLVPSRVTLMGFRDDPGMANDLPSSSPVFHTQKITTSVDMPVGEPFYLGSFSPPRVQGPAKEDAPGEVWLSFLHVYPQQPLAMDKKAAPKEEEIVHANLDYTCYSLDRAAAREILMTSASVTAPWEKLQALVAGKKAKLEFISSVRTKSGQRMVTEAIQEVRYMEQYHAADFAEMHGEGGKVSRERLPGYATAFETRNAGLTVEVEPVIRPDFNVDVNQVIQNVNFLGMLKVSGLATRHQAQPLFQNSKVTTSITLTTGKHTLIGTLNPPGADGVNDRVDTGRTWLLFVGTTVSDR